MSQTAQITTSYEEENDMIGNMKTAAELMRNGSPYGRDKYTEPEGGLLTRISGQAAEKDWLIPMNEAAYDTEEYGTVHVDDDAFYEMMVAEDVGLKDGAVIVEEDGTVSPTMYKIDMGSNEAFLDDIRESLTGEMGLDIGSNDAHSLYEAVNQSINGQLNHTSGNGHPDLGTRVLTGYLTSFHRDVNGVVTLRGEDGTIYEFDSGVIQDENPYPAYPTSAAEADDPFEFIE